MSDRKTFIKDSLEDSKGSKGGIEIHGNHNIVGNVNTTIKTEHLHITPGPEHITEEQAAKLKYLVHEVARLECIHSKNPVFMPAIWNKLKEYMGVASYKFIPHGHFHEAEAFLHTWRERILDDQQRSREEVTDRSRVYRICHAIAKQYNDYAEMRTLMRAKWQKDSMRQLADHQLQELLAFMRALEAQHNYKEHK